MFRTLIGLFIISHRGEKKKSRAFSTLSLSLFFSNFARFCDSRSRRAWALYAHECARVLSYVVVVVVIIIIIITTVVVPVRRRRYNARRRSLTRTRRRARRLASAAPYRGTQTFRARRWFHRLKTAPRFASSRSRLGQSRPRVPKALDFQEPNLQ